MLRGVLRTARYARSWKAGAGAAVEETDLEIERDGERISATLVLPRQAHGRLPGWIALGGISCMGRHHPQLVRFARALSSSGAAVLVPEIPEWRRLELAPRVVAPTVRACIDFLSRRSDVTPRHYGLIGFSFGAPQVAIAAAREDIGPHVAGVVLFGGYCCMDRTMTCQLTGEHEWDGTAYTLRPDPFGGWVVGANRLTDVPGYEDASDVAGALRRLATAASGQRVSAWDPRHDDLIAELRDSLPAQRRPLFRLFATRSDEPRPEPAEAREIALGLAEACRRAEPLLDTAAHLHGIDRPTRLIHGRGDRLIPFTEGLRLRDALPPAARGKLTVTGMFNHSADSAPAGALQRSIETLRMVGAIRDVINTV